MNRGEKCQMYTLQRSKNDLHNLVVKRNTTPSFKWAQDLNGSISKTYTNDQQAHAKMLNIINH